MLVKENLMRSNSSEIFYIQLWNPEVLYSKRDSLIEPKNYMSIKTTILCFRAKKNIKQKQNNSPNFRRVTPY